MGKSFDGKLKAHIAENPAKQFISAAAPAQPTTATAAHGGVVPKGYKVNTAYVETKNKHIHLTLQPSIYEQGKQDARELGLSFNEYISRLIAEGSKGEWQA